MTFTRDQQRLFLMENDQLQAEITFPVIDDTTWLIEHIWVRNQPTKRQLAASILDAAMTIVQTEHKRVVVLDPFARQVFATTPAYQTLMR
ncbi:N-acetyltransferase [Furfurilactobacillus sp. WILCCON 0119]|uniref:N-acetyltransferase n=1 Tax=Furfurilactobacillus entadae TaxID=2922307 RepID=UPI0035EC54D4